MLLTEQKETRALVHLEVDISGSLLKMHDHESLSIKTQATAQPVAFSD